MKDEALILLIEDNEADVDLIKYTFRKNKIANRVLTLSDGESAVAYLLKKGEYQKAQTPDLVILDINLPRLNGLEVLKIIKQDPYARLVPVVILTTSSADQDVLQAYQNYVNAYLVKPVEIEDFIKVVTSLEQFMVKIIKKPNLEVKP